jgi:hypothetical protein
MTLIFVLDKDLFIAKHKLISDQYGHMSYSVLCISVTSNFKITVTS